MKRFGRLLSTVPLLFAALSAPARAGEIPPEKVAAVLPELERFVERTLERTGVPGMAVAVVHKGRTLYVKGYGVREVGKDGRVDGDTVFQLASVSKPLSSTVLAVLVGEGVVRWDDRVIDHDPGFRLGDPFVAREVTIRDLLCHRSGLPGHAGDLLEDMGYDRDEILRRLRFEPSVGFRSTYAYTNFGYTEAAVAGAKAAGAVWEDLAAEKLFRPLGMKSTSYRFSDYAAAPNRAVLHVRDGGRWAARHTRRPDAQSPAGGASSSARDLARWLSLHLTGGTHEGRRIVDAGALAETHRPQVVSQPPRDPATDRAGLYALGWNVNHDDDGAVRLGHSGAFDLGAATAVSIRPADGLGIVALTNGAPIGVPESVCASFLDLVLRGRIERDWFATFSPMFEAMSRPSYGVGTAEALKSSAPKSPPGGASAYVGVYRNDYHGDFEVVERDGTLRLRLGPKKVEFPLRHLDRDVFVYQPEGEMSAGPSAVAFSLGPDRKASRIVVEILDQRGLGTFVRKPSEK